MALTIDCGEGRHDVCRGAGRDHYLVPQENDGTEFECACSCHLDVEGLIRRAMEYLAVGRARHVVQPLLADALIKLEEERTN